MPILQNGELFSRVSGPKEHGREGCGTSGLSLIPLHVYLLAH